MDMSATELRKKYKATATESSGPKRTATEPTDRVDIALLPQGEGARPPRTVIEVFQDVVRKHGNRPALAYKTPVGVRKLLSSSTTVVSLILVLIPRENYKRVSPLSLINSTGMNV